jgi:hypothetical protein
MSHQFFGKYLARYIFLLDLIANLHVVVKLLIHCYMVHRAASQMFRIEGRTVAERAEERQKVRVASGIHLWRYYMH